MSSDEYLYGGIEGGGTKFMCVVGSSPESIAAQTRIPTTVPQETLGLVVDFFAQYRDRLRAIGIGSFGPVDLNRESPTWGFITSTPKPGWQDTDVAGFIGRALKVPVAFDTDVNAAALGEMTWGNAQGVRSCLYITLGTGVGGGAILNGRPLHGLVHPEMGHVRVPRADGDDFPGACPFHGDCLEGMVSGPALQARTGRRGEALSDDDPSWRFYVHYVAHALLNFICTLSPERVVVGGGVAHRPHLLPLIRTQVRMLLNDYVRNPALGVGIDDYIVSPGLGDAAGSLGAMALAASVSGR